MTTALPAWLRSLIDAHALEDKGVRFYDDDERAEIIADVEAGEADIYEDILPVDDETIEAFRAELRTKIPVAVGPVVTDSLGSEYEAELWIDKNAPTELLCAVQGALPPSLWIPAGRSAEELTAALSGYAIDRKPPEAGSMKSKRFFLGVVPDFAELENRFVMGAFTDPTPLRLGTAVDDEDASTIVSVFETISSRSRIVLEGYTRCVVSDLGMMLAGEVQYTPRAHAKLVAAHNARFETNFPEDMPVDVIAALMGMPVLSREGLLAQIAAEPDAGGDQPLFLMALALVLMDPDEVEKAISPYAEHRELHVRQSVASLARSFGLRALIERMAPREQDEELRAMLEEALSEDEDEGDDEDEDEDGDGQA